MDKYNCLTEYVLPKTSRDGSSLKSTNSFLRTFMQKIGKKKNKNAEKRNKEIRYGSFVGIRNNLLMQCQSTCMVVNTNKPLHHQRSQLNPTQNTHNMHPNNTLKLEKI